MKKATSGEAALSVSELDSDLKSYIRPTMSFLVLQGSTHMTYLTCKYDHHMQDTR